MIVLDASVILKWIFTGEDGGEKALYYRDNHISGREKIAVPDLFFYEIANVLATKTVLSLKDCSEAFSLIYNFDFESFPFGPEDFLGAMNLSKGYGITLYDAVYIEMSQRLRCKLVTADKRLFKKVKGLKDMILLQPNFTSHIRP